MSLRRPSALVSPTRFLNSPISFAGGVGSSSFLGGGSNSSPSSKKTAEVTSEAVLKSKKYAAQKSVMMVIPEMLRCLRLKEDFFTDTQLFLMKSYIDDLSAGDLLRKLFVVEAETGGEIAVQTVRDLCKEKSARVIAIAIKALFEHAKTLFIPAQVSLQLLQRHARLTDENLDKDERTEFFLLVLENLPTWKCELLGLFCLALNESGSDVKQVAKDIGQMLFLISPEVTSANTGRQEKSKKLQKAKLEEARERDLIAITQVMQIIIQDVESIFVGMLKKDKDGGLLSLKRKQEELEAQLRSNNNNNNNPQQEEGVDYSKVSIAPRRSASKSSFSMATSLVLANKSSNATNTNKNDLLNLSELIRAYDKNSVQSIISPIAGGVFQKISTSLKSAAEKSCLFLLQEIYETEMAYVVEMKFLISHYLNPLSKPMRCKDDVTGGPMCEHNLVRLTCVLPTSDSHPTMKPEEIKQIFTNLDVIFDVNYELLLELHRAIVGLKTKQGSDIALVDVLTFYSVAFSKTAPFLKLYGAYCMQYPKAIELLEKIRLGRKDMDEFLHERGMDCNFVSLNSLLIKPVQRICKYPLLFENLLTQVKSLGTSSTAALSTCIKNLSDTVSVIKQITESVNNQMQEIQANQDFLNAFEELGGETGAAGLFESHRRFITKLECFFVDCDSKGYLKTTRDSRVLYIFNDLLVVAKWSSEKLKSFASMPNNNNMGTTAAIVVNDSPKNSPKSLRNKQRLLKIQKRLDYLNVDTLVLVEDDSPPNEGDELPFQSESSAGIHIRYFPQTNDSSPSQGGGGSSKSVRVCNYEIWFANKYDCENVKKEIEKHLSLRRKLAQGQRKAFGSRGSFSFMGSSS